MGRKKEYDYIAHVCLNSKLEPIREINEKGEKVFISNHPDFCDRGFVDIAPSRNTTAEQCWKYCPECEAKGFEKIKLPEKNLQKVELMKSIRKNRSNLNAEIAG